jgi:hypothetical protein
LWGSIKNKKSIVAKGDCPVLRLVSLIVQMSGLSGLSREAKPPKETSLKHAANYDSLKFTSIPIADTRIPYAINPPN